MLFHVIMLFVGALGLTILANVQVVFGIGIHGRELATASTLNGKRGNDRGFWRKEYVAMAPNSEMNGKFQWLKIAYDPSKDSAEDVKVTTVDSDDSSDLGNWFDIVPAGAEGTLSLTAKIDGNNLYSLVNVSSFASENTELLDSNLWSLGGCCANVLRIQSKTGNPEKYRDIKILPIIQLALKTNVSAPTHTFFVQDGIGFFICYYKNNMLGPMVFDSAIVAIDLKTEKVVPTKDGKVAFRFIDEIGTLSTDPGDSIFKIQYYKTTSLDSVQEFHANGIQLVKTKTGKHIMALTHYFQKESFILLNPYVYPSKAGGGSIVQRFGTPYVYADGAFVDRTRRFGLEKNEEPFWAVHNVHYNPNSFTFPGKETFSIFVNKQGTVSRVFEYVVKLVDEESSVPSDESVFDTDYVGAKTTFFAPSQGGSRSIGNGVFLVASGGSLTFHGFQVVDAKGVQKLYRFDSNEDTLLYDPFIVVPTN